MKFDDIIFWVKKVYFAVIVAIGLCLLFVYTFKYPTVIDVNEKTLALIVILMIAPILNRLSKIKVGNLLEAEIAEEVHEKVVDLYQKSETDTPPLTRKKPAVEAHWGNADDSVMHDWQTKYEDIINTGNTSLIAGIVKLRYNLETSLSELYSLKYDGYQSRRMGAGSYINPLLKAELISPELAGSLREVIDIANQAIHGKDIRDADIKLAILAGVNLLKRVDAITDKVRKEREVMATAPEIK